jgi:hypothetical protein
VALKTFVAAFDIHGDKQDKGANKVLFDFIGDFKPDIRICGGDVWDFRPLRQGASNDDLHDSMGKDYDAGMTWLKKFKPHYFLLGNHDDRLWHLSHGKKGDVSFFAGRSVKEVEKEMADMSCQILPYAKRSVLRLGHLKLLHGFWYGVNAARQHANCYGACLFGHIHTISEAPVAGLERRVARSVGCLCDLNMEFQKSKPATLVHAHGFAYGYINEKTGSYTAMQAENVDGTWVISSDFKTYGKK